MTLCDYLDEEGECAGCVAGFYVKEDKTCERIVNNPFCVSMQDPDKTKCTECQANYAYLHYNNGTCSVVPNLIKGCREYEFNGIGCRACEVGYELKDGSCEFIECKTGQTKVEYCGVCELYYFPDSIDGKCHPYDGSKDDALDEDTNTSNRNKIQYGLLMLILLIISI